MPTDARVLAYLRNGSQPSEGYVLSTPAHAGDGVWGRYVGLYESEQAATDGEPPIVQVYARPVILRVSPRVVASIRALRSPVR